MGSIAIPVKENGGIKEVIYSHRISGGGNRWIYTNPNLTSIIMDSSIGTDVVTAINNNSSYFTATAYLLTAKTKVKVIAYIQNTQSVRTLNAGDTLVLHDNNIFGTWMIVVL